MTSASTSHPWYDLKSSQLRVFEQPSLEGWAELGSTFRAMGETCFQEAENELERETGFALTKTQRDTVPRASPSP